MIQKLYSENEKCSKSEPQFSVLTDVINDLVSVADVVGFADSVTAITCFLKFNRDTEQGFFQFTKTKSNLTHVNSEKIKHNAAQAKKTPAVLILDFNKVLT